MFAACGEHSWDPLEDSPATLLRDLRGGEPESLQADADDELRPELDMAFRFGLLVMGGLDGWCNGAVEYAAWTLSQVRLCSLK